MSELSLALQLPKCLSYERILKFHTHSQAYGALQNRNIMENQQSEIRPREPGFEGLTEKDISRISISGVETWSNSDFAKAADTAHSPSVNHPPGCVFAAVSHGIFTLPCKACPLRRGREGLGTVRSHSPWSDGVKIQTQRSASGAQALHPALPCPQ